MPPSTFLDWIIENLWAVLYLGLVLLAGIGVIIAWIMRASAPGRLRERLVEPWRALPGDFWLFLCCLMSWFWIASAVLSIFAETLNPDPENPSIVYIAIAGLLLQGGMAGILAIFFHSTYQGADPQLSSRRVGLLHAAVYGVAGFLALFPVVFLLQLIWGQAFELLRGLGLDIPLETQDSVRLLGDQSNPWVTVVMTSLAVVVAPVVEEAVFRGGIYRFLKGRVPLWLAIGASSVAFSLVHYNLQSFPGLMAVGIACCLAYEFTGSLRVPVILHAAFNLNSIFMVLLLPPGSL